jgi:hypothetical protein
MILELNGPQSSTHSQLKTHPQHLTTSVLIPNPTPPTGNPPQFPGFSPVQRMFTSGFDYAHPPFQPQIQLQLQVQLQPQLQQSLKSKPHPNVLFRILTKTHNHKYPSIAPGNPCAYDPIMISSIE